MNALRGKEGERNIRQRPLLDAVINSVTKTASSETPEDAPEDDGRSGSWSSSTSIPLSFEAVGPGRTTGGR